MPRNEQKRIRLPMVAFAEMIADNDAKELTELKHIVDQATKDEEQIRRLLREMQNSITYR